ncbi:MAG: site-2 protease family protein [Candidatus Kerfeldbacteria bacterium]|nr:site-2 protease family protein [Candidatus Kerfeldbacteria bacterium]
MGLIQLFSSDPTFAILAFFALMISIGFHEFSHVFVAYTLGDLTGKLAGRLTLNPLRHLDAIGTLMILFIGVGYGKPAPFNPGSLRYRRWGPTLVALGGPISNLLFVGVFGVLWRVLQTPLGIDNLLIQFLEVAIFFNAALAVFNLLPVPPLDGSHLIASIFGEAHPLTQFLRRFGWQVLLALVVFDLFVGVGILGRYLRWGIGVILTAFGLN